MLVAFTCCDGYAENLSLQAVSRIFCERQFRLTARSLNLKYTHIICAELHSCINYSMYELRVLIYLTCIFFLHFIFIGFETETEPIITELGIFNRN